MKDVMCSKMLDNMLTNPEIKDNIKKATEEIFKYVVQPSCEVKYNEELLSLRDKININTLFLLNQLDGGHEALKKGKEKQLNEQKSNRNTKEPN
jgi:hypothetical protein